MFKARSYNQTNRYELEIENFVTKMHGTATEVWESIFAVSVDYAAKKLAFKVFDLQGGLTECFFDQLFEDPVLTVRLRVKRADGGTDYVKQFHGAKIEGRKLLLTAQKQDPSLHHVLMSYDRAETEIINDNI